MRRRTGAHLSAADGEQSPFDCPRCGRQGVQERFYGPCSACRVELAATLGGEGGEREAERFEPRMHVTPNAVAQKE